MAARGGAAAAVGAVRRVAGQGRQDHWHAVTVNCAPRDVWGDGELPPLLAELGDSIEARIVRAPDGKGTEIHARARSGGRDLRRALRRALRESRSLLEVGEVIEPNCNRTTHPTLLNRPLATITSRGRGEGLL